MALVGAVLILLQRHNTAAEELLGEHLVEVEDVDIFFCLP